MMMLSLLSAVVQITSATDIKYKSGKDVGFEELLIQGQLKRPEIAVVTGNAAQGADGLLRLREHFLDRVAIDQGESAVTTAVMSEEKP